MSSITNVSAAKPKVGGAICVGPMTATLPTTADETLANDFVCLGYIAEDGVTNSASPNTSDIKAWGGDTVYVLYDSKTDTLKFKMIESLDPNVKKVAFGDANVSGDLATGITVTVNNKEMDTKAYVFDMILRNGALHRIVVPAANVSALGDVVYVDNDIIAYEVTISALADTNGNTHYEYTKAASNG